MNAVLFLTPADLGETVLATGALAHVSEQARALAIVCSPEAAPLFRAAPKARTHALPAKAAPAMVWRAWRLLFSQRFDLVIDARGGLLGRSLGAKARLAPRPGPMLRHRVEEWSAALGADATLAPKLWLDDEARRIATELIPPQAPLLVLAPGGITPAKRWPAERFAAVARRLAGGALAGAQVALVGAAARDADITRAIANSLDADGVSARDLGAGLDLLAAAALMERATLVIGNDNALTHIAAAVGAPTLTLFGPTDERVRAPWGPRARTLRGRDFQSLMNAPISESASLLEDISVDAVEAAALDLMQAGGLR